MDVEIDLKKEVVANASYYYERSKKLKRKVIGAEEALRKTLNRTMKVKHTEEAVQKVIVPKPEKKWYHRFRWFYTSEGFLVVGGRDASSNEALIKKHLEPSDLVFHANVRGAPFFAVKNPKGLPIPEKTLNEAAEASAAYSSAWKAGVGSCDVYCIEPEQVSKTPESGEYLTKGAFVIRGKRRWFRNVRLIVAVGLSEDGVIGGPVDAVKSHSGAYLRICVGDKKSTELAKAIQKFLKNDVNLDDVQRFIPAGQGKIIR